MAEQTVMQMVSMTEHHLVQLKVMDWEHLLALQMVLTTEMNLACLLALKMAMQKAQPMVNGSD